MIIAAIIVAIGVFMGCGVIAEAIQLTAADIAKSKR